MILFVLCLYNCILKITCFPFMMKIENKIIIMKIKINPLKPLSVLSWRYLFYLIRFYLGNCYWNNSQHCWESIVCQALKTTYFYTYFRNKDTKNREVNNVSVVTWSLIFRAQLRADCVQSPCSYSLNYTIFQSLLRADFWRDPTKPSLRLATRPPTSTILVDTLMLQVETSCYKSPGVTSIFLSSAHILIFEE